MADLVLTAGELMDASPILSLVVDGLKATETEPAIPPREFKDPRGSYAIGKIARKSAPELKDLDRQRVAICVKHCRKDDKGEPVMLEGNKFDIENIEGFNTDYAALRAIEVTLSGCRKITVDETAGANISPAEFQALAPFVVDEE